MQTSTSPPIQLFLTTIASQPALRQRQEYLLRILQVKQIKFSSYDLASDEAAKRLWKRKAPVDKQQLPGILVGGEFVGVFTDFEEAVEHDEVEDFLRLSERFRASMELPVLPTQAIGVPGVYSPKQMTPSRLQKTAYFAESSPLKEKGKVVADGSHDLTSDLPGFGLQGVKVSDAEINALIAELGLEGDDAKSLARSMSISSKSSGKGKARDSLSEQRPAGQQAVMDELKSALGRKPSTVAKVPESVKAPEVEAVVKPVDGKPDVIEPTPVQEAPEVEALSLPNEPALSEIRVVEPAAGVLGDDVKETIVEPPSTEPHVVEPATPSIAKEEVHPITVVEEGPAPVELVPVPTTPASDAKETTASAEPTPEPLATPGLEPVAVESSLLPAASLAPKETAQPEIVEPTPAVIPTPTEQEPKAAQDIIAEPVTSTPVLSLPPSVTPSTLGSTVTSKPSTPALSPRVSSFASPLSPASIPVPDSPALGSSGSSTPTGSMRGLNFRKKSKTFQSTVTQDEKPVIEAADMSNSKENK